MELHQLKYFLAVAQHGSFSRAAEEINVSQSALSIQIGKLEAEFGVRLFERATRSLSLTAAGQELREHARKISDEMELARESMELFVSADRGHIRVGAFPGSRYYGFLETVSRFKREFPDVKLSLHEAECRELLALLSASEIDVAFFSYYNEAPGVEFHHLYNDHLILAVRSDHPLAGQRRIGREELSKEPLVMDTNISIYRGAEEELAKEGLSLCISMEASGTLSSRLGFVSAGAGSTLLSSPLENFYGGAGFAFLDIEPPIPRNMYLAVLQTHRKWPVVQNFVRYALQKHLHDENGVPESTRNSSLPS